LLPQHFLLQAALFLIRVEYELEVSIAKAACLIRIPEPAWVALLPGRSGSDYIRMLRAAPILLPL
jgi:hypothetical protein